jgi:SAM-dependent methyltransferase
MSSGILRRTITDASSSETRNSVRAVCFNNEEPSTWVRPCFDESADTYAEHALVQRAMARWLGEWLEPAESLRQLRALELGAGDGCFTRHLAERTSSLTAIDEAPRMVQRGRDAVPSVHWRVGDAWTIGAKPVDRLYSASLLQWCPTPREALAQWRRVVQPGGRMLHGFYVAPTLWEWESLAGPSRGLTWRTAEEWDVAFREAGWGVLRHEVERRRVRFESALALLRFFHKTGAATTVGMSAGTVRRILREYEARFAWRGRSVETDEECARSLSYGIVSTWAFFRIEAVNEGEGSCEATPRASR